MREDRSWPPYLTMPQLRIGLLNMLSSKTCIDHEIQLSLIVDSMYEVRKRVTLMHGIQHIFYLLRLLGADLIPG